MRHTSFLFLWGPLMLAVSGVAVSGGEQAEALRGPKGHVEKKDWARELRIGPVVPKKDSKTGFVVGGKNTTALIRSLKEINGITIADLERLMRPGALSMAGFLGKGEKLLDVLAADNRHVVEELGLTHQELAMHLHVLAALGQRQPGKDFTYCGRRFRVRIVGTHGFQDSPFRDGTRTSREATVQNVATGKTLWYSLLVPHLIERYGFYEGKGTRFRVDPRKVIEVLDFLKKKRKR
jgi:hypothetical protein